MKKQCTDQIPKLLTITIILSLLLLVGCQSFSIPTPDLVNPLSMSPRVGVNPNQKYQEVIKFSAKGFRGINLNVVKEQISEAVKGSERKAIKEIEISIEQGGFVFLFRGGGRETVSVEGSVIEIQ